MLWTDESKFNSNGSDGKTYVRRRPGEEFNPKCTKATVKHDPISINVWGCMTSAGTGPIYRVKGMLDRHQYVDDILDGVVRPFVEQTLEEDWVFQVFLSFTRKNSFFKADNDPKHASIKAKTYLSEQNWNVMKWPAQSPDLNPIEMLWIDLGKAINAWKNEIKATKKEPHRKLKETMEEKLFQVSKEAWASIAAVRCANLVGSMKRRCLEVIKNKGMATSY